MTQYQITTSPIESTVIEEILQAFPGETFSKQYAPRGLRYKIDLYHEEKNLVIEIDENGHATYDEKSEEKRTESINHVLENPTWHRFNPDSPQSNIFKFIGEIYTSLKIT